MRLLTLAPAVECCHCGQAAPLSAYSDRTAHQQAPCVFLHKATGLAAMSQKNLHCCQRAPAPYSVTGSSSPAYRAMHVVYAVPSGGSYRIYSLRKLALKEFEWNSGPLMSDRGETNSGSNRECTLQNVCLVVKSGL